MEFLRSFLRRHLAGKPMVASQNIGVFAGCPILEFSQGFTSSRLWAAINLGERRERTELVSNEGLNGVYRQPSKGLKINRQPVKMEVKINGIPVPRELLNRKNHFPCSHKHFF